jgi:hypothetical protein
MTDVDDFLAEIHPRLVTELRALHNGDPGPRLAMWSTEDPVTLLGAGMSGSGWERVSGIFRSIASRWSDCTDQRVELLAAGVSGDLAYTVPGGWWAGPLQQPGQPTRRPRDPRQERHRVLVLEQPVRRRPPGHNGAEHAALHRRSLRPVRQVAASWTGRPSRVALRTRRPSSVQHPPASSCASTR